jgi:hypothetical protein
VLLQFLMQMRNSMYTLIVCVIGIIHCVLQKSNKPYESHCITVTKIGDSVQYGDDPKTVK